MPGRHGLAAVPAARKPLRVVPETRHVEIELEDGTTQTLRMYVNGAACPIDITIDVDEVVQEWEANAPTPAERDTLTPRQWIFKHNRAERILRRDILCRVIPGLDIDHANVLASDDGPWQELLIDGGWWAAPTDDDDAEENADPEATAPAADDESTGATDSPDLSPATASTP